MKLMTTFFIAALFILLAVLFMAARHRKAKITRNDCGQKYVYEISLGDLRLKGYSNYEIDRVTDVIYCCDFIDLDNGKTLKVRDESYSNVVISRKDLDQITVKRTERDL